VEKEEQNVHQKRENCGNMVNGGGGGGPVTIEKGGQREKDISTRRGERWMKTKKGTVIRTKTNPHRKNRNKASGKTGSSQGKGYVLGGVGGNKDGYPRKVS